jgi:hypothetical protein
MGEIGKRIGKMKETQNLNVVNMLTVQELI